MKKFSLLLVVFLLLVLDKSWAGGSLYSAEVPVTGTSVEARQKGIRDAFVQMLVKVTGNRSVANRQGVQGLVAKASSYMQQYRYRVEEVVDPEAPPLRFLRANFDRAAVEQGLRDIGLQPWNATRPRTLVWLVRDHAGVRRVVNTEQLSEIADALNQAADRRGFPLRLPLFDLTDQTKINAAQLWNVDVASIEQASARYPQNVILVGRITHPGDRLWSIDWTLIEADNRRQFVSAPAEMALALADGVDQALDRLAVRFAPVSTETGLELVRIRVLDVRDLGDYARVMNLLGQQDAVGSVALGEARGQELMLRVQVRGDASVLRQSLELSGELVRVTDSVQVVGSATEVAATYRLR